MAKDGGKTTFTGTEPVNTGSKENIILNGETLMVKALGKGHSVTNQLPPGGTPVRFSMLLPLLGKDNLIDRYCLKLIVAF